MHAVGLHHPDIVSKCSLLNFYLAMIVLYCKLLGGGRTCVLCVNGACVCGVMLEECMRMCGVYACVCVCVCVCV